MKQVLIQSGAAIVEDVPVPQIGDGEVLVRAEASCLSTGTEMSDIRNSGMPLWKKALQQPEKVRLALDLVRAQGLRRTLDIIQEKREAAHPTGYSAAGVVVSVGAGIGDLTPGTRVACAGAAYAYHAEFFRVPRNLCVRVPVSLDAELAAPVALGAIALQGIRRAQPTLGETFVVIGLGVLGQLTVQLLRANGCRAIGVDLAADRIALARKLGMEHGRHPEGAGMEWIGPLTDGHGADGVIITAATASNEVVANAFKLCRRKGRVVLVGDVGLNLNRGDFYAKEIDFLISTSYGPGRYDERYEEHGLDYPISHVRWTENRNMAEYIRLAASGALQVAPLVSARFPIDQAPQAYASLGAGPLLVLLKYPATADPREGGTRRDFKAAARAGHGLRIAVVGVGEFARSTHLPNLVEAKERLQLRAVVSRMGHSAVAAAKQFGADYAATDFAEVLADDQVEAVLIATRHNLHAGMALQALKAGKHVLLEKPLALHRDELGALNEFVTSRGDGGPILMTGYNRRFSPYARRLSELTAGEPEPFIMNYRMNAGFLPATHWVHGPEGGGRNVGEACHIYDLFTFLADAELAAVSAHAITPRSQHYQRGDNFVATMSFANGAVATLTYTALGAKDHPKEIGTIYCGGKVAELEDYKQLDVVGGTKFSMRTATNEKGWKEELNAFADGVRAGTWPIPWWQQVQAAEIALRVDEALAGGGGGASKPR